MALTGILFVLKSGITWEMLPHIPDGMWGRSITVSLFFRRGRMSASVPLKYLLQWDIEDLGDTERSL